MLLLFRLTFCISFTQLCFDHVFICMRVCLFVSVGLRLYHGIHVMMCVKKCTTILSNSAELAFQTGGITHYQYPYNIRIRM